MGWLMIRVDVQMLMSWFDWQKGCSSPGLDIGDSPVTVSREQKQKAGKVKRKREREQKWAPRLRLRQDNILSEETSQWVFRPGPERLFPADTDPPLLPSLGGLGGWAPVTSLESRGQHQPQCPLISSLHLAPVTGHSPQRWSAAIGRVVLSRVLLCFTLRYWYWHTSAALWW